MTKMRRTTVVPESEKCQSINLFSSPDWIGTTVVRLRILQLMSGVIRCLRVAMRTQPNGTLGQVGFLDPEAVGNPSKKLTS